MPTDLPRLLKEAEAASDAGDQETALRLCAAAIEQYPTRYEGYEARSGVLRRLGRLSEAFADLEQVMRLVPDAAAPYFTRGCWKLASDDHRAAVEDFTRCQERDDGYFGESIHFYRAEAYLHLGAFEAALTDCAKVSDDYWEMYFFGHKRRTKQDIVNDAMAGKAGLTGRDA